jgi:hypothetical protein
MKSYAANPAAPIDCFYVYPTVSQAQTGNAGMTAAAEEQHVAAQQFAQFAGTCRTYAPIYLQTTVAAMRGGLHLARLITEEIEGRPAQRLLVSAILAGGNV